MKKLLMIIGAALSLAAMGDRVVNEDVTLAADADWSADGLVTIKPGARINLAGHNLTVADIAQETDVITNATGVVAGYKDLALIRTSSGTLGYINTDIVPEATDRIVLKVRYEGNDKPQAFFFTSRKSAGSEDFTLTYYKGNGLRIDFNGAQNIYGTNVVMTVGNTYEIDFDANAKTCAVNGDACLFNKSFPTKAFTPNAPLCIFQISNNGTPATSSTYDQYIPRASLYYFFVYGSDGTLKHELRPARETSTNKTGLYDRKTDKFYPSSKNFHDDVADPSGVTNSADGDAAELVVNGGSTNETVAGYTVLKSITANGNQCVKVETTYMTLAATDRVEMKLKPTDVSATRCFWSSRVNSSTKNYSCWQQPYAGSTGDRGLRFDFNSTTSIYGNPKYYMDAGETHEIVFDGYTRTVLVDGEDKGFDISPGNGFEPSTPLFILPAVDKGSTEAPNYRAKCELYSFKLYDKDGNLKLDMVPVYSEGESEAGLYDRVGKTFFKSATGTAFVRGENADDTTLTVTTPGVASSCSVLIDGNVKLVKDGNGVLTVSKAGQTYTGGTEVRSGTLKLGSNGNYTILHAAGTVTVCDGGTFEMDGRAGWDGRSFVLDGGTLQNSTDLRGSSGKWDAATNRTSAALLGNITLTKDSTFAVRHTYGFNDGAVLNLGGHTLRAEIAKDEILVMRSAVVSNGTFAVNGGWLCVPSGKTCDATDNAAIRRGSSLAVMGTLNVNDYEDAYTLNGNSYGGSAGAINIYGTFTPKSDYFYGVTMQSGSSFDLSTKTDPWNVASSAADNNAVSFADNAAIGLVLGERTTSGSIPVVTWTTAPANLGSLTFRRVDAGRERSAAKESSGIYFRTGLIITFH